DLVAIIDSHEVVVTECLIRTQLHFDDANGIFDMPINDILEGMRVRVIRYLTDGTLTFLKNYLSPQWRFLVHTIMHCLSPKSGSWNQFLSSIATTLICLSTAVVRMLLMRNNAAINNEAAGSALRHHLYASLSSGFPLGNPHRSWPSVPVHSPIQTFIFEEPLVFGPEPRPAGYCWNP
ncbi:hypothetical protein Tco_0549040, partial [Tanacetum coccineum]